jgi:4-amino-4-deoxychorismate lyase
VQVDEITIERYARNRVNSLRLVDGGNLDYQYKYAVRTHIDQLFRQRQNCDDVLIIKHGLITDTSYANVAFYDGVHWYTPATPLLAGTKRQELLDQDKLIRRDISPSDVANFSHCIVFNAMLGFNERWAMPVDKIRMD